jgi:hypothetical protein
MKMMTVPGALTVNVVLLDQPTEMTALAVPTVSVSELTERRKLVPEVLTNTDLRTVVHNLIVTTSRKSRMLITNTDLRTVVIKLLVTEMAVELRMVHAVSDADRTRSPVRHQQASRSADRDDSTGRSDRDRADCHRAD